MNNREGTARAGHGQRTKTFMSIAWYIREDYMRTQLQSGSGPVKVKRTNKAAGCCHMRRQNAPESSGV